MVLPISPHKLPIPYFISSGSLSPLQSGDKLVKMGQGDPTIASSFKQVSVTLELNHHGHMIIIRTRNKSLHPRYHTAVFEQHYIEIGSNSVQLLGRKKTRTAAWNVAGDCLAEYEICAQAPAVYLFYLAYCQLRELVLAIVAVVGAICILVTDIQLKTPAGCLTA